MERPGRPWRRRLARGAAGAAALLVAAGLALVGTVEARWDRTFDVPVPALRATRDPAAIARGRYLAYGPARCASCHVAPEARAALAAGGAPPLEGGGVFSIPAGTWYTPNLTPDAATGIGRWTDGQLARALRHNVRPDGRALMGAMEFQGLADDDVVALLSFLRAQPAVRRRVPEHQLALPGRAIAAFVAGPIHPATPPPAAAPRGLTAARGAYLADAVARCDGCHTQRDLLTQRATGTRYAGGATFPTGPGGTFVSPNLTPHPRAGRMARWSEAEFVGRMRGGRAHAGSPMPWESVARMRDEDLRAIYRYLRTLPPAADDPGPSWRPSGATSDR